MYADELPLSFDGTLALLQMLELHTVDGLRLGDSVIASAPVVSSGNEADVIVTLTANPKSKGQKFTGSKRCKYRRVYLKDLVKGRKLGVLEIPAIEEVKFKDETLQIEVDPFIWICREFRLIETEFEVIPQKHQLSAHGVRTFIITAMKDSYIYYGSFKVSFRQKDRG